jgi:monothiol glutaredoxin
MAISETLRSEIEKDISENSIMIYMKGTPDAPQCGFSAQVVRLMDHFEATYASKNVLEDESLREGIKEFSDWPTIPQAYISGEFAGGCDILMEMAENGELQKLLASVKD